MKISALLVSAVTALMLVVSPSVQAKSPKVTKLTFPKGSYCTSFTGYYHDRVFSIYLLAGQTLEIKTQDVVDSVVVRSPKGKRLPDVGAENYNYKTQQKGKHTIRINRASINGGSDTIEFCAY